MTLDWRIRYALLALIWGFSFMFIRIGVEALAPLQVALVRMVLGSLTLLVIMAVRRERLPREPRMWGHMTVAGLMYNAAPFTLFSIAATLMPSGLSGIANATTPLFTLLLAVLFLPSERPTPTRLAGIGLGFAGVLVVLGGPRLLADLTGGSTGPVAAGMALALGAAACYGVASVYTRRFLTGSGYATGALAAGQVTIGAVVVGLPTPFLTTLPYSVTPRVALSMLTLGVLCTGVTYLLFYGLVSEVGATIASTVTYLLPVVAVLAGVVVLGERLTWYQLVGGAVVLLGAVIALRPAERPEDAGSGRRAEPTGRSSNAQPVATGSTTPVKPTDSSSPGPMTSGASAGPASSSMSSS